MTDKSYFGYHVAGEPENVSMIVKGNLTAGSVTSTTDVYGTVYKAVDSNGATLASFTPTRRTSTNAGVETITIYYWTSDYGINYSDIDNIIGTNASLSFGFDIGGSGGFFLYILVDNASNNLFAKIVAVSDYRIKENFRTPKNNILERLCSINMFDYNFKKTPNVVYENKDPINQIGFFAHELQEMFPEYPTVVTEKKDQFHEDGTIKLQQINSPNLDILLMKSIQEQNNELKKLKLQLQEQNENINQLILIIQTLQAEVEGLKSK